MIGLISCRELTPYQLLGRPSQLSLNFIHNDHYQQLDLKLNKTSASANNLTQISRLVQLVISALRCCAYPRTVGGFSSPAVDTGCGAIIRAVALLAGLLW